MIDLRDDGTIAIDFENGAEPVVLGRPKFGAYKRLRAEAQRLLQDQVAYLSDLQAQEEPKLEAAEITELFNDRSEKNTVAWWDLLLNGDPSFKTLTVTGTVPLVDDWPPYLIYGDGVIRECLDHWRHVPLAVGGTLRPTENTQDPTAN